MCKEDFLKELMAVDVAMNLFGFIPKELEVEEILRNKYREVEEALQNKYREVLERYGSDGAVVRAILNGEDICNEKNECSFVKIKTVEEREKEENAGIHTAINRIIAKIEADIDASNDKKIWTWRLEHLEELIDIKIDKCINEVIDRYRKAGYNANIALNDEQSKDSCYNESYKCLIIKKPDKSNGTQ